MFLFLGKQLKPVHCTAPIQVATLRATYGEPFGYMEPYPYKKKQLNFFREWLDNTHKRLNENSKVLPCISVVMILNNSLICNSNQLSRYLLAEDSAFPFFKSILRTFLLILRQIFPCYFQVLVVEGNVAVGKNDFAKRLAKAFDLRYYPSVKPERAFLDLRNMFDKREINPFLPESCKVELFYHIVRSLFPSSPE